MPEKPYVGISGVTNTPDARQLEKIFVANGLSSSERYSGMIGYLIDEDGLKNNLKDRRHITFKDITELLSSIQNVLVMIHYSTEEPDLASQVSALFEKDGIYGNNICRSIQLNIHWPEINQIEKIMKIYPKMKILLSVTPRAIKESTSSEIAEKLAQYDGLISYVLIDPSFGQGKELDTDKCLEIYNKIVDKNSELMIGFAGGLGPENTKRIVKSLKESLKKPFCIDAESALRDKRSEKKWDDDLNLEKASHYISAASSVLL